MREGLRRVLADTPVRHGYVEALLSWRGDVGAVGRLEAGYRPLTNFGLFGYGQWTSRLGGSAGVGARVEF